MPRKCTTFRVRLQAGELGSVGRLNMRSYIPNLLIVAVATLILHGQTPGGSGIVYGKDDAFAITAPDGWVLDNRAEQNNGLHAVFYPVGSSQVDAIFPAALCPAIKRRAGVAGA
jgi:hypothetical protein